MWCGVQGSTTADSEWGFGVAGQLTVSGCGVGAADGEWYPETSLNLPELEDKQLVQQRGDPSIISFGSGRES